MRFAKNAPGLFYTTGGCTACGTPESEAPDLPAPLTEENWDLLRPTAGTPEEIERACCAVEVCCLNALRYGGTDPAVIRRLGNRPDYGDHRCLVDLCGCLARTTTPGRRHDDSGGHPVHGGCACSVQLKARAT
jgi:hypothetical protein